MKRKTTKEIIAESFQEIAAKKEFGKITINDIMENCGRSPSTFYRYFQDKYDLIAWKFTQDCYEIVQRYDGSTKKRDKIVNAWIEYCEQNKSQLLNMLTNTSGSDSFMRCMTRQMTKLIENEIISHSGEDKLTEMVRMKINLYCSVIVWLSWTWLKGEQSATAEEVGEVILEMIQMLILPLFGH